MSTLLRPIGSQQMDTLEGLFRSYVKEMTPYVDQPISASSLNLSERLSHYWVSDKHWAYFIIYRAEIAGFCFIRHYPKEADSFDIDQFYISEDYKRKGIGRETLRCAVNLHPGKWIVRVLTNNSRALAFWLSSIYSICGEEYNQSRELDGKIEMDFIRFSYKVR